MGLFSTPQAELAINHTHHGGMMGAVKAEVTHRVIYDLYPLG